MMRPLVEVGRTVPVGSPCAGLPTSSQRMPEVERTEPNSALARELLARVTVKPAVAEPQRSWEMLIAGYLYLGGLGAGAFALAVICEWLGLGLAPQYVSPLGAWRWDWSQALLLWGPLVTAIGASLLIFHLGRNWFRFWTAGNNPRTSWMARGFSILLGFVLLGFVVFLLAVFAPAWTGDHQVVWHVLQALGVLLALGTAIYTGILVQSMGYIPAWSTPLLPSRKLPLLPFLFTVSALSTGAMGVIVGAAIYRFVAGEAAAAGLVHTLEITELGLLVVEAALLALYIRNLRLGKPEGQLSARMLLSGSWRYGFWGGVVGAALALPFLIDAVNLGLDSVVLALVAATSVLLGGFLLRLAILSVGIKETPPLYKLSQWRAAHPSVVPARSPLVGGGR